MFASLAQRFDQLPSDLDVPRPTTKKYIGHFIERLGGILTRLHIITEHLPSSL